MLDNSYGAHHIADGVALREDRREEGASNGGDPQAGAEHKMNRIGKHHPGNQWQQQLADEISTMKSWRSLRESNPSFQIEKRFIT